MSDYPHSRRGRPSSGPYSRSWQTATGCQIHSPETGSQLGASHNAALGRVAKIKKSFNLLFKTSFIDCFFSPLKNTYFKH